MLRYDMRLCGVNKHFVNLYCLSLNRSETTTVVNHGTTAAQGFLCYRMNIQLRFNQCYRVREMNMRECQFLNGLFFFVSN